jgi:hypothetical protein
MLTQIIVLQHFCLLFLLATCPMYSKTGQLLHIVTCTKKNKICSAVLFFSETEGARILNYSRNRASDLLFFLFWNLLCLSQ